jgi:hypothetical protein
MANDSLGYVSITASREGNTIVLNIEKPIGTPGDLKKTDPLTVELKEAGFVALAR